MYAKLVEVMGNNGDMDRCLGIIHGGATKRARVVERH
jgi:hypothetical protein